MLKFNRSYETLDGDDDVLLLGKASFTVRRFKELALSKFNKIINRDCIAETNQSEKPIIQLMQYLLIDVETQIMGINWMLPQEGIDCQILKIGSKGWQKGKLLIEVNKGLQSWETQVCIKFYADEPGKQKSPFDDIRYTSVECLLRGFYK